MLPSNSLVLFLSLFVVVLELVESTDDTTFIGKWDPFQKKCICSKRVPPVAEETVTGTPEFIIYPSLVPYSPFISPQTLKEIETIQSETPVSSEFPLYSESLAESPTIVPTAESTSVFTRPPDETSGPGLSVFPTTQAISTLEVDFSQSLSFETPVITFEATSEPELTIAPTISILPSPILSSEATTTPGVDNSLVPFISPTKSFDAEVSMPMFTLDVLDSLPPSTEPTDSPEMSVFASLLVTAVPEEETTSVPPIFSPEETFTPTESPIISIFPPFQLPSSVLEPSAIFEAESPSSDITDQPTDTQLHLVTSVNPSSEPDEQLVETVEPSVFPEFIEPSPSISGDPEKDMVESTPKTDVSPTMTPKICKPMNFKYPVIIIKQYGVIKWKMFVCCEYPHYKYCRIQKKFEKGSLKISKFDCLSECITTQIEGLFEINARMTYYIGGKFSGWTAHVPSAIE